MKCIRCDLDIPSLLQVTVWAQSSFGDAAVLMDAVCASTGNPTSSFSCCGSKNNAKWNVQQAQWQCRDCNSILSNDPNYLYRTKVDPEKIELDWGSIKKAPACECGADTAKTTHARWCPKWM